MKTILRRMFPEAEVEELYDNPCFAEQMADIGVQFVQKKGGYVDVNFSRGEN